LLGLLQASDSLLKLRSSRERVCCNCLRSSSTRR
jgi:hypothetical protein